MSNSYFSEQSNERAWADEIQSDESISSEVPDTDNIILTYLSLLMPH